MKPDMVKAMLPVCACGEFYAAHHPECPALRAYLALSADHEALVKRVESAELIGAADGWGACRSLLVSGMPPEQVMRMARENETELRNQAARLTEKAKP